MRQSYLKNAALMTGADVLLRLAGMGLRIWLANALGGEGMGLYQLVLAVSMFCPLVSVLLVALDNLDFVTTFTAVLATLNNIGPGLGLVGPTGCFAAFSPLAKIVLTADMLFGRLELFPMLILLMPSTWRKY